MQSVPTIETKESISEGIGQSIFKNANVPIQDMSMTLKLKQMPFGKDIDKHPLQTPFKRAASRYLKVFFVFCLRMRMYGRWV